MLAAIVQALTLLVSGSLEAAVAAMTPREKAAAVVVAGMPAGPGFGCDLPSSRAAPSLARAEDVPPAAGTRLRRARRHRLARRPRQPIRALLARLALRAGADMVLTTSARDAKRIVEALVPLALAGELDAKLVRVLRYRCALAVR